MNTNQQGTGRYATPEMDRLWNEHTKLHLWVLVETAAARALAPRLGTSEKAIELLLLAGRPTVEEAAEEEQRTRHDVVAFLNVWRRRIEETGQAEGAGEAATAEAVRAVHWGMTSSDLVDSANALRWSQAAQLIAQDGAMAVRALAQKALDHRETARIGRTHGQWAEETTLGHQLAEKTLLMHRALGRLARATGAVGRVKLSGPVGNYKRIRREEELQFARLLGQFKGYPLPPVLAADCSTQVVARDGLAELMDAVTAVAGAVAAIAGEVRLGAQSEVQEIFEPFGSDQTGSSSMPHKRNPVTCEQLSGLYKVVKDNTGSVKDGVVLWGERDISHSSVERVAVPTVLGLGHYMVRKLRWLVDGLEVDRRRMAENLERARPQLRSAAAMSWLQEQGVKPSQAWGLVAEAVKTARREEETLEMTLPKVARAWLKVRDSAPLAAVNWAAMKLDSEPGDQHLWELMESLS